MSGRTGTRSGTLAEQSPTLFLVGGGLFAVFAVLWGIAAVTDFAPRPAVDVVGPAGWTAAFFGLLGLYHGLSERTPWLARAGAVCATVGVVGGSVAAVVSLGELAGIVTEVPSWSAALTPLLVVGILPGFLAFAIASLRSDARSRTVGLLLLAPAAIFAVNIVRVGVLGPRVPTGAPFVLGGGQALALLAIGYALRTGGAGTGLAESPTDAST